MTYITHLPHRSVIRVSGTDRVAFLQGLITQDVTRLSEGHAIYGLLLTPQGRFLYDLFLIQDHDTILVDSEDPSGLKQKLMRYRLRSDVTLTEEPSLYIATLWGEQDSHPVSLEGGCFYEDPRLQKLGTRVIASHDQLGHLKYQERSFENWDHFRLQLGVPDGSRDMLLEKAIPLECGVQDLQAISWDKGCYMGQELTARTHYRGLVRKRLLPVALKENEIPPQDTPIRQGDQDVGEMRSHLYPYGLALLRLEALHNPQPLVWGECQLEVHVPEWAVLL